MLENGGLMNRESKWNKETQAGTYHRPVHHGEVLADTKTVVEGNAVSEQNLAAQEGMDLAKKLLQRRNQPKP